MWGREKGKRKDGFVLCGVDCGAVENYLSVTKKKIKSINCEIEGKGKRQRDINCV